MEEDASECDHQPNQGCGILRKDGTQGGIRADKNLFQGPPFQLPGCLSGLAEGLDEGKPFQDKGHCQNHIRNQEVGRRLRLNDLLDPVHDGNHGAGSEQPESGKHGPDVRFAAITHGMSRIARTLRAAFGQEQEHLVAGVGP